MAELERIRRAREEERARAEAEAAALAAKERSDSAALSNPLLSAGLAGAGASAAVRKRFGDDTVFSNTHASEPEAQKRFINDMIRSDFHRSFLRKFVT